MTVPGCRYSDACPGLHLAHSLEEALDYSAATETDFVTREGDVVAPDGTVSGGSAETAQNGIIHKKREIRSLELLVENLIAELESCESERDRVRADLQGAAHELLQARSSLHQLDLTLAVLVKDRQQLEAQAAQLAERLKLLVLERSTLDEEQCLLQEEQKSAAIGQEAAELQARQLEQ